MKTLLALLAVSFAPLALAGVQLDSTSTDKSGVTTTSQISLQGNRMRVDHLRAPGDAQHGPAMPGDVTLFDGARIMNLNSTDKTYVEVELGQLQAQMAKFQQMKNNLPPETRARMEAAEATPDKMGFEKATGGDKIAGIACENYQVLKDGQPQGTACLSLWKNGALTKADAAPLAKLLETLAPMRKLSPSQDFQMSDLNAWPGWPLLMKGTDGRELTRVTKVAHKDLPAATFEVPAGYTRKSIPAMGGGAPATPPPSAAPAQ